MSGAPLSVATGTAPLAPARRPRREPVKHVFLWPVFIIVLGLAIFPLTYSLIVSFQNARLVPPLPPRFIGLDNYATLLTTPRFWHSLGTTAVIVVVAVAAQYVLGLAVAMMLHARVRGEALFRVIFLLPMLMTPVAVALLARQIFHPIMGPLNAALSYLGIEHVPFLTEPGWAVATIIMVDVWQWTPFMILMLLAGLQSLPTDIYEAASLENATPWQQFRGITFPMLLPVSAAVIFVRLIEGFKIMDTVFVMTGGGPGTATDTLTLFAYQEGFRKFNLGYTSAMSFLFAAFMTVLALVYLAVLRPHLEKRR